ncbi:MAG: efflux RND transporter permease subunit [Planctomycetia bacterium]|nr:efflux RND transporter permease subunit [Planctomycetia bacterium]
MVSRLVNWSLDNPLMVIIATLALVAGGFYAFLHVNVEAYPDPAPAIIEIIAKYPGASAEEVERQVTTPLEVALAGMPGLKYTRSKSLFGLSHVRNQFEYGIDYYAARQEVINRLQFVKDLPEGVEAELSPTSPTGEIMRYTLHSPRDADGKDIYSLNDLKTVQDWILVRKFRRIPRIIDTVSSGGTVKAYEVRPDPDRLLRYGITLKQLETTVRDSNANIGGDYLIHGDNLLNVRSIGLIGNGVDPMQSPVILNTKNPEVAAKYLRDEEKRRIKAIRDTVIVSVNNVPIRVEDVTEGGPIQYAEDLGKQGVVVTHKPRMGRISISYPDDKNKDGAASGSHDSASAKSNKKVAGVAADGQGTVWLDDVERVQGIILLRKGEASLPALRDVKAEIDTLNAEGGELLPGVKIEPYYDRTELIGVKTHTVHENLLVGMTLVTLILLMFLTNVRCALIVAINVPLALLVAFSMLYLRGRSANLLSIGAVDFGIIVDSSVIIVENIYRHLTSGQHTDESLKTRIFRACCEVERGLFFTTAIMVCAFLPLFTMKGPEGQIFGPMADTYAFALGGALVLALTIAPVLCLLFFKNLKPVEDNFMVRWLKSSYLRRLEWCLKHRNKTLVFMTIMVVITAIALPTLGREFMPELEEGNLYVRGTFPINVAPNAAANRSDAARAIMRKYDELEAVVSQNGRPDDGTDPTGFYNLEFFLPLKPRTEWPITKEETGWRKIFGKTRPRTKEELIDEMNAELSREIVGANWNFSQNIRDNVMESLSGVKGDNSIKIFGPNLVELERLAEELTMRLKSIPGIVNVGVFRVRGQPNLELPIDTAKCNYWGVSVEDVNAVVHSAVGGKPVTDMIEGEKRFDIVLRFPEALRNSEEAILNIPVDVYNNRSTTAEGDKQKNTVPSIGMAGAKLTTGGTTLGVNANQASPTVRRRLGDLVTPMDADGIPNPDGRFVQAGASTIYREQGKRMIAVKFSVRGRDLAGAVAEAQAKTADLFKAPYSSTWSGEFDQMREAEQRLMLVVPVSMLLVFLLIYLAFRSLLDTLSVFANVIALSRGGFWALIFTGTNFSISAAVGFISIFGVAIMDGLLLISYFNQLRAHGLPLHEAIMSGAEKRVRPMMMTALTAILGLLPAAVSTKIGAQTQQPLAIVVVGGMLMTLLINRYLMPVLYSLYGHREPSEHAASMAH